MTEPPRALSALERDVLAFEAAGWTDREAHDQAARDLFELTPTRYTQVLVGALKHPAALALHPTFVRRAQRLATAGRGLLPPVVDPRQRRRTLAPRRTT